MATVSNTQGTVREYEGTPLSGVAVPGTYGIAAEPSEFEGTVRHARQSVTPLPNPHEVVIATSRVSRVVIWAPNQTSRIGMDGVAETSSFQGQFPYVFAYLETAAGVAITQAMTRKVTARIFRTSVEGGDAIYTRSPSVSSSIYDTVQTASPASDGYNLAVQLTPTVNQVPGGATYPIEVVVELTTNEKLTVQARWTVRSTNSEPINVY